MFLKGRFAVKEEDDEPKSETEWKFVETKEIVEKYKKGLLETWRPPDENLNFWGALWKGIENFFINAM